MFFFSACETLFMISMAMSYFYSWQTYSVDPHEVEPVDFWGAMKDSSDHMSFIFRYINNTRLCLTISRIIEPISSRLETIFGRGGNLAAGNKMPYGNN